jgi:arylsulfatase A-like enzyme
MTGVLPSQSGVYLNSQPWRPAMPDAVTLQQYFQQHGYLTIGRGKIYHGSFPDDRGWDEYIPKGGDPGITVPPEKKKEQAAVGKIWAMPIDGTEADMDDYKVAGWTIEQLQKTHDKPFFLACGFFKPHLPWNAPKKYHDMFPPDKITLPEINENDLDDIPEAGRRMAKADGDHKQITENGYWRQAVSNYLACIAFTDAQVGRVLDGLDQSAYRDNTIIVLWSDHGWHLGEKLHWRKFALWEEATHNIMMWTAPGVTQTGGRCDQPVSLQDIYPTMIELCGLKPKKVAGQSLVPLMKNPALEWDRPALTTYGRNNHSLRTRRWRYIRYADGSEELYDHDNDPLEWTNLANDPQQQTVIKTLSQWLPTANAEDAAAEGQQEKQQKKTGGGKKQKKK